MGEGCIKLFVLFLNLLGDVINAEDLNVLHKVQRLLSNLWCHFFENGYIVICSHFHFAFTHCFDFNSQVIATHPYDGEDEDELTFEKGAVILVVPYDDPEDEVSQANE